MQVSNELQELVSQHGRVRLTPLHFRYAGSGKSKVFVAVLWYLFQHDATHLVVVTSYTWKAAQLVGNAFGLGYSSSTLFGVDGFSQTKKIPGETAASRPLLHRGVRMILNDEISFTSQDHLWVSTVHKRS